ncbi:peptidyl-tRNA hydrolase [Hoyosella sp. G463]|uniref:peptidyl-tRNA hydrolase n=1 Tax=Lolliginicoccus lacisalsi TaxID=2742202 RepID=A0A927JBH4_9ACTN|nr:aminoacyl-tRNA hydrolase [Lolliginicoccus lacisalsi]MBD8506026.1 peptidyl-tRNA hydrolase [Lolliginicoccus lacisalsi]
MTTPGFLDAGFIDAGFIERHAALAEHCHPRARHIDRPDPDDPAEVQAMQMVLHIPRADPPPRHEILAAAAASAIAVCLHPDTGLGGPWHDPLHAWMGARIRKVARRARGTAWDAAQSVPGVTSTAGTAHARALVPGRIGDLDPRIKKLQISGTDIPPEPEATKRLGPSQPVLAINTALGMTVGKAAAQAGHASMLLGATLTAEQAWEWARRDYGCTIIEAGPARWAELLEAARAGQGIVVRDAGFTEIAPGSATVIAHWGR